MSERVEGATLPPRATGKKSRRQKKKGRVENYPFDQWLDGAVWRLHKGADYQVSHHSMRSAIYGAAKRRGLRVETRMVNGVLLVQRTGELGVKTNQPRPTKAKRPEKTKWRFWR